MSTNAFKFLTSSFVCSCQQARILLAFLFPCCFCLFTELSGTVLINYMYCLIITSPYEITVIITIFQINWGSRNSSYIKISIVVRGGSALRILHSVPSSFVLALNYYSATRLGSDDPSFLLAPYSWIGTVKNVETNTDSWNHFLYAESLSHNNRDPDKLHL